MSKTNTITLQTTIHYPFGVIEVPSNQERLFSKLSGRTLDAELRSSDPSASSKKANAILWGHFLIIFITSASITTLFYYLTKVKGISLNPFSRKRKEVSRERVNTAKNHESLEV